MHKFPAYKITTVKRGKYRSFKLESGGEVWEGPVRAQVINDFMTEIARRQDEEARKTNS